MHQFTLPVIGTIRTPYGTLADIPRQAHLASDVTGRAEVFPEYSQGLRNLDESAKVYLFFAFHTVEGFELITRSRLRGRDMGVFATRSPKRPSRLGMSLVEVVSIENGVLVFKGVDMLDGSPLLDIKPWLDNER